MNLLTPRSRVLPEKLQSPKLLKKFPAFYGTRRFIIAFTRIHHLSLSWARLIQSMPPPPIQPLENPFYYYPPIDEGMKLLRNVGKYLPIDTASYNKWPFTDKWLQCFSCFHVGKIGNACLAFRKPLLPWKSNKYYIFLRECMRVRVWVHGRGVYLRACSLTLQPATRMGHIVCLFSGLITFLEIIP
jgi:hypothetical protein